MWEVLKIIAGFIFDLVVYLRLVHVSDDTDTYLLGLLRYVALSLYLAS